MIKHTLTRTFLALATLSAVVGSAPPLARVAEAAPRTEVVTFQITGMVTKNCPVLVKSAVRRIAGVEHVEASLEAKTAVVRYVVGKTSPEAIAKVIESQTGFKARVASN